MTTSTTVQQTRPTSTPEHQAYVALQQLATRLRDEAEELLKAGGLSGTQFNVLRILRGSGALGLTCGEIGVRLISKDPDVTRLLDRLEKLGWVERARSQQDRRVVLTRLSPEGQALVGRFDVPLAELHRRQFAHLPPERLEELLTLLREDPRIQPTHQTPTPLQPGRLHPDLRVDPVDLTVSDLRRSLDFYWRVLGIEVLAQGSNSATLGVARSRCCGLASAPAPGPRPPARPACTTSWCCCPPGWTSPAGSGTWGPGRARGAG